MEICSRSNARLFMLVKRKKKFRHIFKNNQMSGKGCSLLIYCFRIDIYQLAVLLMSVSILSVSKALMITLTLSAVLDFSLRRTTDMQIAASHYASSFLSGGLARRIPCSHLWSFSLET